MLDKITAIEGISFLCVSLLCLSKYGVDDETKKQGEQSHQNFADILIPYKACLDDWAENSTGFVD